MNLNIDWILAMTVFVLLVAWSFVFYSGLFEQASQPVAGAVDTVNEKITDFLETDVYDIVVRFNISAPQASAILYINLTWPTGTQNSTQVYLGTSKIGTNLTCNITNNILYWRSNLVTGDNYFLVHFSNRTMDLNCTSTKAQLNIYASGQNQTVAWVMERKKLVSQAKIDMLDPQKSSYMSYEQFRNATAIEQDFRVEIGNTTSVIAFGGSVPLATAVYVRESRSMIEETNEKINITLMVW